MDHDCHPRLELQPNDNGQRIPLKSSQNNFKSRMAVESKPKLHFYDTLFINILELLLCLSSRKFSYLNSIRSMKIPAKRSDFLQCFQNFRNSVISTIILLTQFIRFIAKTFCKGLRYQHVKHHDDQGLSSEIREKKCHFH